MTRPLEQGLRAGASALELDLSDGQVTALLDYVDLIQKWNRVYNLTAVRDPNEMLTHHLLDSLAVVPSLAGYSGVRLLDVGSGAGLPGVVIAICRPDLSVTCVDTVSKKASFIQQVAMTLKLPNLRGLHARVETLTGGYDLVTSRAFASLADFVAWSGAALEEGGVWMALKGKHPAPELADLERGVPGVEVFHVEPLAVPGLDAERCIAWMRRKARG